MLKLLRKLFLKRVSRYADGLVGCFQGIFHDGSILMLADDNPNGCVFVGKFNGIVQHRQIELHFAGVFGFELANFQLQRDQAT
ncbi:hypothetical protein CLV58_10754 [Spirosoma oryzae]|uniref:Uncharacterized protein n=1 Tax=Spirosoma oryzae TaxID=1469603 RepID=A0A2T0T2U2_9BACT|nr:hypothetical protein CLV58_10754 [Spirosoma oryzae]